MLRFSVKYNWGFSLVWYLQDSKPKYWENFTEAGASLARQRASSAPGFCKHFPKC